MSSTVTVKDVPADQVDAEIQNLKNAGATKVDKTQQPDGNYTLTATFPD